jgi:Putative Ig domain
LPVEVTLKASGDAPSWLELDRERLSIRGTAPITAADQTYQLSVRAHAEGGSNSRVFVVLTITEQPDRITPTPQLRGHWTW